MKLDAAAVHADPDGGIRWWHEPTYLDYARPVISVSAEVLRDLLDKPRYGTNGHDPIVSADGYDPDCAACWDQDLVGLLTRWLWSNAEHLYRVHSYDPDSDCYLLVWPD